jgi:predicted dehydrogenase
MERLRFGLIGCGGMGRRHLAGYAELLQSDFCNMELVAVCDLDEQNAEELADEARALVGQRPRVFQSITTMTEAIDGLSAVDITTDVRSHHRVAIECLERGLHIQIEKPLGLTMRACNLIVRAARRTARVLSVAENYRRDPMNRLVRALIDDGAIGEPQTIIEATVRGADRMVITPWRHQKLAGGLILDIGVHSADVMRYFMGEAESAAGTVRLLEPIRYRGDAAGPGGYYQRWASRFPQTIRADAEDALWATIRFRSGAVGQWTYNAAGKGLSLRQRLIYGSKGSIAAPADRSGRPVKLHLPGKGELSDAAVLELAPSYRLCAPAAQLFGGERPSSYRFSFAEIDRKLVAIEHHEFGQCVLDGARPEVTGEEARRDCALVYAACESSRLNRFVTLDEVEEVKVDQYQRDIDADLGLIELPGFD